MCTHDHIALEISSVTKRFVKSDGLRWPWKRNDNDRKPVVAVDRVSFQVRRGEVFGILGPNGSGKSTLVRCIATLLLPDEGRITVFGHDVLREEMAVKQLINRVSVEASFFKKLTPMENLLYGARLYGLGAREARQRVLEVLERLGLKKEAIFRPMEEMSRGADDPRDPGAAVADLRRLLPHLRAAGMDAAPGAHLPRHLYLGGDTGGAARRGQHRCLACSSGSVGAHRHDRYPGGAGDLSPGGEVRQAHRKTEA